MIYTHILNWGGKGVKSPADDLSGGIVVSNTETTYPPSSLTKNDIIPGKCGIYETIAGGVLCRDTASQRCYEENV